MKKIYLFLSMFLCVAMAQAQTDLMSGYNGGFETGDLTGWRSFEVPENIGSNTVIVSSAHSGTKAAKMTFIANSTVGDRAFDNWDNNPPVLENKAYELKAWLKSDNPATFKVKITFGFFDADHTLLSEADLIRSVKSTYSEFKFQQMAPPMATSCFVSFRMVNSAQDPQSKAAGTLYVDDVQIFQLENNFNALNAMNGDFELGSVDEWRFAELGPTSPVSSVNISTSDVHGGRYAAEVNWGKSEATTELLFDQYVNVSPEVTYTYTAWAKSLSGPFILHISSAFLDGSQQPIMTSLASDLTWVLSDTYTQHSFVLPVSPADAKRVNIGFRAFNADGSRWPATDVQCLIDDVQLNQSLLAPNAFTTIKQYIYQIYPNPAAESINIISSNKLQSACIYSISGQKVKDINSSFNNVDISDLQSGVYFIKAKVDGVESSQKLVVK